MKKPLAIALLSIALTFASWGLTSADIIARVEAKYAGLTSIAFDGSVVSEIDRADAPEGRAPRPSVTNYKVRLTRPNLYRIEWSGPFGGIADEGAAWSSGGKHYILVADQVSEQVNLDFALGATGGVSRGVTNTIPSLFFRRPSSVLRAMANVTVLPNEKVGDLDCYVLGGDVGGHKLTFWITKDFLVIQKRHTLGGSIDLPERSDADVQKGLVKLNLPSAPEDVARMQKIAQFAKETRTELKGSTTETIESIEVNPKLEKELFDTKSVPALPALPR